MDRGVIVRCIGQLGCEWSANVLRRFTPGLLCAGANRVQRKGRAYGDSDRSWKFYVHGPRSYDRIEVPASILANLFDTLITWGTRAWIEFRTDNVLWVRFRRELEDSDRDDPPPGVSGRPGRGYSYLDLRAVYAPTEFSADIAA